MLCVGMARGGCLSLKLCVYSRDRFLLRKSINWVIRNTRQSRDAIYERILIIIILK